MRPVVEIVMPTSMAGQRNGRLDPSLLVAIDDIGNMLESHAAIAWFAMVEAAARDGVELEAEYTYRTYEAQEALFRARYVPVWEPGREHVEWNGVVWTIKPGGVTAAKPGNSNHGWGLAVDVDNVYPALPWLLEHAVEFGWSWEAGISEREPWHLHYFLGDDPPVAPVPEPEPLPLEVDMIRLVVVDDPAGAQLVLGAGTLTWIASGSLPPIYDFARVPVANVTVEQVRDILRTHDTIGQAPNQGALLGAW